MSLVRLDDVLKLIQGYEVEMLALAEKKNKQQKWLLEGYYKAVAVHCRKIMRAVKKLPAVCLLEAA